MPIRVKTLICAALVLLSAGLSPAWAGREKPEQDEAPAQYRGVWAHAWADGHLSREQAIELVENCRKLNLNAIFLQIQKIGDAYYKSKIHSAPDNLKDRFDPLQTVIELAHDTSGGRQRLEVHAWLVVYRIFKVQNPRANFFRSLPRGHILTLHPDWAMKNIRGKYTKDGNIFLDPGVPGVTEYIVDTVRQIAANYDVDGIHMDYVRYPETKSSEWGYNPISLERFNRLHNNGKNKTPNPFDRAWTNFRRENVTAMVRRVYTEIKALKPGVKVSAATVAWGDACGGQFHFTKAYAEVLQDWRRWLKEGFLDFAVPMNYKRGNDRLQSKDFGAWIKLSRAMAADRLALIGQASFLNTNTQTLAQLKLSNDLNPAGFVLYSYQNLSSKSSEDIWTFRQTVGKRIMPEPAPVPRMEWLENPERGSVAGIVRYNDDEPAENIPVRLAGTTQKTYTDMTGFFVFNDLKPKVYNLEILLDKHTWKQFGTLKVEKGRVAYKKLILVR